MQASWQTLKDKAVEVALKSLAGKPQIVNPTWIVTAEELHDVSIRWPNVYQWPRAHLWVDTLLYGFRRRVKVEMTKLEQPYKGTVNFEFVSKGRAYPIAIDFSDYPEISAESARRCPVYFKMQYRSEGYGLAHVVPGGYVSDGRKLYLHLSRLRKQRDRRDFTNDVYGRFSLEFAGDVRRRAVEILSAQQAFKFEGGLSKVSYASFLKEIARSKICIDLPGEGAFCHRLINYFAIGACVIAAPHGTILNAPLIDRQHLAYTRDDFSDLVELCSYYLENEEEREAMCSNSRRFFEQNLHKDNLTAYYLRTCLDRLVH